jgi:23S rRNA-/tRNA-specific pseudouridylate synthase
MASTVQADMKKLPHLGFPAPLLGPKPIRLPVLHDDGEIMALAKPPGVLVQQDAWYPRLPVLIEAIRYQAAQSKPEFVKMGIGQAGLWAVTDLDAECAGPLLSTRSREIAEDLRNQYGSGAFTFTFEFITPSTPDEDQMKCELPLSRHERLPRMLVSHTTGKVAQTEFSVEGRVGAYFLCSAVIRFPRRHQVLLHACESGLPVLGDRTYAKSNPIMLSHLKRDYHFRRDQDERPLYDGPAYYLKSLKISEDCTISMSEPPRWQGLVKQLQKYSQ